MSNTSDAHTHTRTSSTAVPAAYPHPSVRRSLAHSLLPLACALARSRAPSLGSQMRAQLIGRKKAEITAKVEEKILDQLVGENSTTNRDSFRALLRQVRRPPLERARARAAGRTGLGMEGPAGLGTPAGLRVGASGRTGCGRPTARGRSCLLEGHGLEGLSSPSSPPKSSFTPCFVRARPPSCPPPLSRLCHPPLPSAAASLPSPRPLPPPRPRRASSTRARSTLTSPSLSDPPRSTAARAQTRLQ